jgi:flagellar motor switch protein FliM
VSDDILTQNVIDNLLAQAMGKADTSFVEEEKFRSVRAYDFRHPSKLSKEQLRALQLIFEGFARNATHNLSTMMRTQVHVALVSLQQAVFDEYAKGLPSTTLLTLMTAPPLPGTFVFEYDLETAFIMLDRLLGGVGATAAHDREVTEIEDVLLQTISGVLTSAFTQAWDHVLKLDTKLIRLEYTPRFLQIAPVTEPVLLLLFDLRVLGRSTTMSMCIPYPVLEPIAPELNVQTVFATGPREVGTEQELAEAPQRLNRVNVPITVLLGITELPLGEVVNLQVDDIIRLDGLASDPLLVTVNNKPTFYARPGLRRHGVGVQIVGLVPDESQQ